MSEQIIPSATKGLDVSRAYFHEWALPLLREHRPDLATRVAAGRFTGSDSIGADDVLSRDHWWGPWFDLYLEQDDFDREGKALESWLLEQAPKLFQGHTLSGGGTQNVNVRSADAFFAGLFKGTFPKTPGDWVRALPDPENDTHLYFLRHGELFYDGSCRFSERRKALHTYPPEVRQRRFAQLCFTIFHYGEYNFRWRLIRRGEPLAIQMALGRFIEAVMRICLLLDNDYSPYWKWLRFAFDQLRAARELAPMLESLAGESSLEEQGRIILQICEALTPMLASQGVVKLPIDNPWGIPWFCLFSDQISTGIVDPEVRHGIY